LLCPDCWQSLDFLSDNGCPLCNMPMDMPEMVCGPCLAEAPRHDGCRAVAAYGGLAADLAIRLKHGRKTGAGAFMADAMAARVPERVDLLLPVPLHRWRLWHRGFNQTLVLARTIAAHTQLPVEAQWLLRLRATPSLGGLGRQQRRRAVQGAFTVASDAKASLKGRHVGLVDDVYTTGATANGCAAVLKRAGAASVTVLCWARVIDRDGNSIAAQH
jgi:ComF family protein